MIQVTQEMRDAWCAEMRFDLIDLEKSIKKFGDTEFSRAGDNPVGIARAEERKLAAIWIGGMIEGFVTLSIAAKVKDEETMANLIDDLSRSMVDYRSADRGCSIMERYRKNSGGELAHPEVFQILSELRSGLEESEKQNVSKMCDAIGLQEQTYYNWRKGEKAKIAEMVMLGYRVAPFIEKIEGVVTYGSNLLKRNEFERMTRRTQQQKDSALGD